MNIPSKPASIDVEIHANFVDGREIEAAPARCWMSAIPPPAM
jgi:hypothetical protein